MRNILVGNAIRAIGGAERVEGLLVEGHAFDVPRLRVTVEAERIGCSTEIDVDANGRWVVRFDRSNGLDGAFHVGMNVRAIAADASDPDGCYASVQTRIE